MSTSVDSITAKAAQTLQDEGKVHWTAAELVSHLNDGQREATLLMPSVSVENSAVMLAPSVTKQALPEGGFVLLDVTRNMGADGNTPGSVIRVCDKAQLDSARPDWHSDANSRGRIEGYVYDQNDPKTYYVFPKAPSTNWHVQLVRSVAPAQVESGDDIGLDDLYANALLHYILYRAYAKDAEVAQNAALANSYNQLFRTALGVKPIYQNGVPRQ